MFRDVLVSAPARSGCEQVSLSVIVRPAQIPIDRLTCQFGDRAATSLRLVPQSGIELVWQLYRRSLHGMPAYHSSASTDASQ